MWSLWLRNIISVVQCLTIEVGLLFIGHMLNWWFIFPCTQCNTCIQILFLNIFIITNSCKLSVLHMCKYTWLPEMFTCVSPYQSVLLHVLTYGAQTGESEMSIKHLQNVPPRGPLHIHTEPHALLSNTENASTVLFWNISSNQWHIISLLKC